MILILVLILITRAAVGVASDVNEMGWTLAGEMVGGLERTRAR